MAAEALSDAALAEVLWAFHHVPGTPVRADLILGLGSYDLRVADRCAELFHQGVAPRLVFSGASGNWTRDRWQVPEAEVFAGRAQERGVPADVIWQEREATNIAENLSKTKALVGGHGLSVERVVVVTKPNTLRRVAACLPVAWPEVAVELASPEFTLTTQVTAERSLADLTNEMVGDLQRLWVYPRLGYTESVAIPDLVREAYANLVARGYTEHLMPDQPLVPWAR